MFLLTPGLPKNLESRKNLEFHNSGKKKRMFLKNLELKKKNLNIFNFEKKITKKSATLNYFYM